MSHQTARGNPCGLKDGHKGHHKSEDYTEKHRVSQAQYKKTVKGILTDQRYEATRRGGRASNAA